MSIFGKILRHVKLRVSFMGEALDFYLKTVKFNASSGTARDREKMRNVLLRESHTLEKGMSLRDTRKGFGQAKALHLISGLEKYAESFACGKDEFPDYPLSVIKSYIEYTKASGCDIPELEASFSRLMDSFGTPSLLSKAGVELVSGEEIRKMARGDFRQLLCSRHSLRCFKEDSVPMEDILKALELAQRTPSACNRQAWRTHVFTGKLCRDLLVWQDGCHGFEDEIKSCILVCADLRAFLSYETHQAYVDGALYAMNLINSLHYLGYGTIPLSCGFALKKLKGLRRFDIPENEIPILIVGVGIIPDELKIAVSGRKDISSTNTIH